MPQENLIEQLKDDILRVGGKFTKIDAHVFEGGYRGMIATEDIKKKELLAFVPDAYLMFRSNVQKSEIYQILKDKEVDLTKIRPSSLFAYYMME